MGQAEPREIVVEPGLGGAEVGYLNKKLFHKRLIICDFVLENWVRGNSLPAAVDMPAPVMTTIRLARHCLIRSATAAMLRSERVSGLVSSDTRREASWPILKRRDQRELDTFWCRVFFLRPILTRV